MKGIRFKINNKKVIAFLVLILILVVTVTSMTFAYFSLSASDTTTISGTVGGVNLVLDVTKVIPVDNTTDMIPQEEDALSKAVSSKYNCVDDNDNVICHVYKATISNTGSISSIVNGSIQFYDIDTLPNLKWKRIDSIESFGSYETNKASTEEYFFEGEKTLNAGDSFDYYFVVWVDEIGGEQKDKGTFKATIRFNVNGNEESISASKYIENLYNTGEESDYTTVNIGGDSSNQEVTLNTKQRIMKVDQGDYGIDYRYYGNDPEDSTEEDNYPTKNYVSFNGELWRIISSSLVFSNEDDNVGEQRLRIIKATSIGNYAWNSEGTNNWADATLMCQLNTMYYNDSIGACNDKNLASLNVSLNAEAKSFIDNVLWYLGVNDNYDLYADDYYIMERGKTVADSLYPYRWTGKVGIMYPSDYAYAADLSVCLKSASYYQDPATGEIFNECVERNWLNNGESEILISPISVHDIIWATNGIAINLDMVHAEYSVRPVVVLKSGVTIIGGEGTSGSPYQLALSE